MYFKKFQGTKGTYNRSDPKIMFFLCTTWSLDLDFFSIQCSDKIKEHHYYLLINKIIEMKIESRSESWFKLDHGSDLQCLDWSRFNQISIWSIKWIHKKNESLFSLYLFSFLFFFLSSFVFSFLFFFFFVLFFFSFIFFSSLLFSFQADPQRGFLPWFPGR